MLEHFQSIFIEFSILEYIDLDLDLILIVDYEVIGDEVMGILNFYPAV
jgi:hypothetical protein